MATRNFRMIKLVRAGRNAANSSTAAPDTLAPGELALGEDESTLYFGRADGTVGVVSDSGRRTYAVSSEAAMLALSASLGDMAVRSDLGAAFLLQGQNPAVVDNWTQMPRVLNLSDLNDVDGTIPTSQAALVYNPATSSWGPVGITQLTDGGAF